MHDYEGNACKLNLNESLVQIPLRASMGLARSDHLSPVSPLNRNLLSFSSSGEDVEDTTPARNPKHNRYSDITLAANAQKKLRVSMEKAAHLQESLKRCNSRTQGISERLPALEAFMESLASKAKLSKELEDHIEMALRPTLSILQLFHKVHMYEVHLSEGPKADVGRYIEYISMLERLVFRLQKKCPGALESLHEIVQFLRSGNAVDRFRLHKLHEASLALKTLQAGQENVKAHKDLLDEAFEQLETEFRRILTDYGRPMPVPSDLFLKDGTYNASFIPSALLPAPVVQLLEVIAANLADKGRLMNCLEIYEDVRSWKLYENFQSLSPTYWQYMKPKALDSLQWATLEQYIAMWNQHMYVIAENFLKPERALFDSIFSNISTESFDCTECFGRLAMKSGLGALLDFGEAFSKSQKEPQKIFKLLDMFETLENVFPSIAEALDGDGCHDVRETIRELQKMIVHGACTVFWEFGLQVEVQREGTPPADGGILKLVSYVVNYLKYLISDMYRDGIAEVLRIEQSWRGSAMEEAELSTVIFHVMESLLRNVESRSHMIEEPALSCVFRMNNYWYIYTRSKSSDLGPLLGEHWLNEQRERVEHIALQYQREAWSSVLSHLSMEGLHGSSNSNKSQELLLSRIKAFQEALGTMHLKHLRWRFPSPELREQIGEAALQLVVPAYRSYVFNCSQLVQQGDFMRSQLTAEDVEQMLIASFQEKPSSVRMPHYVKPSSGHANGRLAYESS